MPKGKQSGISFGQRNKQRGQSDAEILIDLKRHIWDKWKFDAKIEWYILFDKEYEKFYDYVESVTREQAKNFIVRNPDLTIKHKKFGNTGKEDRPIVIEVDGRVHDYHGVRTENRNEQFRNAGIKLIVLNLADIKELKKTVFETVDEEINFLLKNTTNTRKTTKKGTINETKRKNK